MKNIHNLLQLMCLTITISIPTSTFAWEFPSISNWKNWERLKSIKNISAADIYDQASRLASKSLYPSKKLSSIINNDALKGTAALWAGTELAHNLIDRYYDQNPMFEKELNKITNIYIHRNQLIRYYLELDEELNLGLKKNTIEIQKKAKKYANKAIELYSLYPMTIFSNALRIINPAYWAYHQSRELLAYYRLNKAAETSNVNDINVRQVISDIKYLANYWARSMTSVIWTLATRFKKVFSESKSESDLDSLLNGLR